MANARFMNLLNEAREHDDYWVQDVIHEFTEELYDLMERREVRKSELADRIGSSPAYITKVMRGNTNFTIQTMVRLVRALNGRLCIKVSAAEQEAQWLSAIPNFRADRSAIPGTFEFQQVDVPHWPAPDDEEEDDELLTSAA